MNSVWRSLLWKEWREHRLVFAAILALAAVIAAILWRKDSASGGGVGGFFIQLAFYMPIYGMFLATGIAAGEQSRGTIRYLQSFPSDRWKFALAKLSIASFIVTLPGLILAALGWAVSEITGGANDAAGIGLASACAALSLLLWTAAIGVNRSDEVRAGMWGLLVIVSAWAAICLVAYVETGDPNGTWPRYLLIVAAAAPAGVSFLAEARSRQEVVLSLLAMLACNAALAGWFISRFGRESTFKLPDFSFPAPAMHKRVEWLAPPRRSALHALIWKQFRETAPLAGLGGATILVVSLAIAAATTRLDSYGFGNTLLTAVSMTWLVVGVVVAIVTGIGVFADDLRPGLNTFWRSRPISVDQWFFLKLVVGGAVTIALLTVAPALLVAALKIVDPKAQSFASPGADDPITAILTQSGIYLLAVAAIAVTRSAVYAAFLTISVAAGMAWMLGEYDIPWLVGIGLAGAMVAIAWLAVRNDWGWKT